MHMLIDIYDAYFLLNINVYVDWISAKLEFQVQRSCMKYKVHLLVYLRKIEPNIKIICIEISGRIFQDTSNCVEV